MTATIEHRTAAKQIMLAKIEALKVKLDVLAIDVKYQSFPDYETPEWRAALMAAYDVFEIDALHDAAMEIADPDDPQTIADAAQARADDYDDYLHELRRDERNERNDG